MHTGSGDASGLEVTIYRRPLPTPPCTAFSSVEGRRIFARALRAGTLEVYFPLSETFHTQSEPAFCGLGSLVQVLNALRIDPGRTAPQSANGSSRGPWRWYREEMLDCCIPLEVVLKKGLTMPQLTCIAKCNGAESAYRRADTFGVQEFREIVKRTCASSPSTEGETGGEGGGAKQTFIVVSYDRAVLGQTGAGHFSPVGGYDAEEDLVLIMDVARFKYPPHWVPLPLLHQAMLSHDTEEALPRGYVQLSASTRDQPLLLWFPPSGFQHWHVVRPWLVRVAEMFCEDNRRDEDGSVGGGRGGCGCALAASIGQRYSESAGGSGSGHKSSAAGCGPRASAASAVAGPENENDDAAILHRLVEVLLQADVMSALSPVVTLYTETLVMREPQTTASDLVAAAPVQGGDSGMRSRTSSSAMSAHALTQHLNACNLLLDQLQFTPLFAAVRELYNAHIHATSTNEAAVAAATAAATVAATPTDNKKSSQERRSSCGSCRSDDDRCGVVGADGDADGDADGAGSEPASTPAEAGDPTSGDGGANLPTAPTVAPAATSDSLQSTALGTKDVSHTMVLDVGTELLARVRARVQPMHVATLLALATVQSINDNVLRWMHDAETVAANPMDDHGQQHEGTEAKSAETAPFHVNYEKLCRCARKTSALYRALKLAELPSPLKTEVRSLAARLQMLGEHLEPDQQAQEGEESKASIRGGGSRTFRVPRWCPCAEC